jgi:uncharacterized protein
MSRNFLDAETSPYLIQHKDNPVHWRPWGPEAFAEAEKTGKPLFVSVGYAACHWCHVMAHESFEDADTAALMNDLYIPVKVDREERPDIDQWLQTALAALGRQGGWPLSAFLTSKGQPFWGGTYFPKDDAMGRPAFKTVLKELAARHGDAPKEVNSNVQQIAQAVERTWNAHRAPTGSRIFLDEIAVQVARRFDIFYGGIDGAPKFPNVPSLELVWRAYLRTGVAQHFQIVSVTLEQMCAGGIYDHLGGGFHRYSTDDRWLVPHFEKMLYDNALLLGLMTLVWQYTHTPTLQERIAETAGWLLREMRAEGGAFASSLDADTDGREGAFYVWTEKDVDGALEGTYAGRFKQVYDVRPDGNFEGHTILHRVVPMGSLAPADEQLLARQRQLLFEAREKRTQPGRDDKVLANWNGLAIASLTFASAVFANADWLRAAREAFQFVYEKMGEGDRLYHSYRAGKRQHVGFADDYTNMAQAALALWEATGEKMYLQYAEMWAGTLDHDFWDKERGGYRYASKDAEQPGPVIRAPNDLEVPSANSTAIGVLARLALATGKMEYAERARAIVDAFTGDLPTGYPNMATFLCNFEFLYATTQIVIVGSGNDRRTHDLIAAVRSRSVPNRLLIVAQPGDPLPLGHPATGKGMLNGQPTAYVCMNNSCSDPVTSPVALSQSLLLQPLPGTVPVRQGQRAM